MTNHLSSIITSEGLTPPGGLTSLVTVRQETRLPWRIPADWEARGPHEQADWNREHMSPAEWHKARERLGTAMMLLKGYYPFYGMIFAQMSTTQIWIDSPERLAKIGADFRTMGTDGKVLYIWPFFPLHATMRELLGVVLHELLHVMLLHAQRIRGRDPLLANMAMDYVVNLLVNDAARGFYGVTQPMGPAVYSRVAWMMRTEIQPFERKLVNPTQEDLLAGRATSWLIDERFRDMTFEQVYDLLKEDAAGSAQNVPGDLVNDHGHWQINHRPADDQGEVNEETLGRQQVREMVTDAYVRCDKKMIGNLPGALNRTIEQWLHPPLPWQKLLTIYMKQAPGDVGWSPGDLRFNEPMPWIVEEPRLSYATFGFDLSGSMSNTEIAACVSNAKAILRGYPQMRGMAIFWDHEVHEVVALNDFNGQIKRGVTGGGGTSIAPQFTKIKELGIEKDVAVHVCFSDGYVNYDEVNPESLPYPCLWVITNDHEHTAPPKHPRYRVARLIRELA